jgi:hypothetical protein
MKLWNQSISRFKANWTGYLEALAKILDSVRDSGTEIELHGIPKIGGYTVPVTPSI